MRLIIIVLLASLNFSNVAASELPPVLKQGFEIYKTDGIKPTFEYWLRGSILNLSSQKSLFVKKLETVENLCGTFSGYSVINQQSLTPSSQINYVQLNYQRCPIFAQFLVYKIDQRWVVVQFNLHSKPQQILPESLLVNSVEK